MTKCDACGAEHEPTTPCPLWARALRARAAAAAAASELRRERGRQSVQAKAALQDARQTDGPVQIERCTMEGGHYPRGRKSCGRIAATRSNSGAPRCAYCASIERRREALAANNPATARSRGPRPELDSPEKP